MRWTAHISILLALAAASAFATVPSSAPTRKPAAAQAQASQGKGSSAPVRQADGKATSNASAAYADGYRKGFADGRAAARKQADAVYPTAQNQQRNSADVPEPSQAYESDAGLPASVSSKQSLPLHSPPAPPVKTGPMPAPLRGSYSSLQRQNTRLEKEGLERIEDQRDLDGRIANHLLVPLPASEGLVINQKLPENRRYCRPWTARFLSELAQSHEATFHEPLEVNSAVRTVAYQKRLRRANSNAAPAKGNVVSPHLTGAAVDIAKEQLSKQELAWMRRYLLPLQKAGKIDVEEEFQQACFHITVYKGYEPGKQRSKPAAQPRVVAQRATVHAPERSMLLSAERPTRDQQPSAKPTPSTPRPARKSTPAAEPTEVIVPGQ